VQDKIKNATRRHVRPDTGHSPNIMA